MAKESETASIARFHKHFYHQVEWSELDPEANRELIDRAAREDLEGYGFIQPTPTPGDATSTLFLPQSQKATAFLACREPLVVTGLLLAPAILARFSRDLRIEPLVAEGDLVNAGEKIAGISGPTRDLLSSERTLLNFLQLLSGIATETHRLSTLLKGSETRLLDTRKTPPGYRALAKYAVSNGGGWNHRLGLYDRIMLKDNHLGAGGLCSAADFETAVTRARAERPDLPIQIEIDRLDQLDAVLAAKPEAILLDNFDPEEIRKAVARIDGRCLTEASGNVTEETLPSLAALGLDFISTGATVHRARWVDIGLDLEE